MESLNHRLLLNSQKLAIGHCRCSRHTERLTCEATFTKKFLLTQDCLAQNSAWARIPYFRIYDLRSTYATRLSAGGVADEWVTQLLRRGDAQVFKKYLQMKLQMKREALEKLNRRANEMAPANPAPMCTVIVR
jgi:hypothetical protein